MKRRTLQGLSLAMASLLAPAVQAAAPDPNADSSTPPMPNREALHEQRMEWWKKARFGMFIHWGLYSVPGGIHQGKEIEHIGEWIMLRGKIPVADYKAYAKQFNPVNYDPAQWAALAKEAGMNYMVITSKHHDGFALFPSKSSNWNVVDATPYGKDLIGPLAKAARQEGLKFGLYYSQAQDWIHPGGTRGAGKKVPSWDPAQLGDMDKYLKEVSLPQAKEIINNYQPDILWWDTPMDMTPERSAPFHELTEKHPMMLTNNRLQWGKGTGDFGTPEQHIPATGLPGDWEVCMTMNDTWGYKKNDTAWKPAPLLIKKLIDIASKGGNFLLNVGPNEKGEIPAASIERLKAIGRWMKVNNEAIYGTSSSPFSWLPWGRCTTKKEGENTILYLCVFDWPEDGKLHVPGLKNSILSVSLLADGKPLTSEPHPNGGHRIQLPTTAPDQVASVVKVAIKGTPKVAYLFPQQQANGKVIIPANRMILHPKAYQFDKQLHLKKHNGTSIVSNWKFQRDYLECVFKLNSPGRYEINALCRTDKPSQFLMMHGNKRMAGKTAATKGFQEISLGTIKIDKPGETLISLRPRKGWKPLDLQQIIVTPAK